MSHFFLVRVRKAQGRGSGMGVALPSGIVNEMGAKLGDYVAVQKRDGQIVLTLVSQKELEMAVKFGAEKPRGRPSRQVMPRPSFPKGKA